jgi:hypothetical protein
MARRKLLTAYSTRPDATAESERAALGNIYRFILDCQARKKGGAATAPDARKEINGSGETIIPRRP